MSSQAMPRPGTSGPIDGRHARSIATRDKIVTALLRLVREGDVSPSAARVAESAGVGLRTVFRHFDEMDTLYREMSSAIEAQVMPVVLKPYEASDWRGRLREMTDRRAAIYETIMPYRVSASIKRFSSQFLMQNYQRNLQLERTSLVAVLPQAILDDAPVVSALEATLSFQCWRRLRHDQALTVDEARAVIGTLLDSLLARIDTA